MDKKNEELAELIIGSTLSIAMTTSIFYLTSVKQVGDNQIGVPITPVTFTVKEDKETFKTGWHISPFTWNYNVDNPEKNLQDIIKGRTKDNKLVYIDFSANYKMKDKMAKRYVKEFVWSDRKDKDWDKIVLTPMIQEAMDEMIHQTPHEEIVNDNIAFTKKAQTLIAKRLQEEGVELKKLVFPYIQEHGMRSESYVLIDAKGVQIPLQTVPQERVTQPKHIQTHPLPMQKSAIGKERQ